MDARGIVASIRCAASAAVPSAARVRQKDTAPEIALRRVPWANGFRYCLKSDLRGRPDLVFPRQRRALFVDGCFWHGCPIHFSPPKQNADFWGRKIERNMARDRRNEQELMGMNWRVFRVWEHDISRAPGSVANGVKELLHQGFKVGLEPLRSANRVALP